MSFFFILLTKSISRVENSAQLLYFCLVLQHFTVLALLQFFWPKGNGKCTLNWDSFQSSFGEQESFVLFNLIDNMQCIRFTQMHTNCLQQPPSVIFLLFLFFISTFANCLACRSGIFIFWH